MPAAVITQCHPMVLGHVSDYLYNMSALTRKEAKKLWRDSIKQAWNNCCAYCGKPPIADASLTIDHIRPKSKGGSDSTSNVTPACLSCNHSKGSYNWQEWYQKQPFYSLQRENRIQQWLNSGQGNFDEFIQPSPIDIPVDTPPHPQ